MPVRAPLVQQIADAVREPLLVLDADRRVLTVSSAFTRAFGVSAADAAGQRLYDLDHGRWDIPALRDLLERVLDRTPEIEDWEIQHEWPHIGRRTLLVTARRIEPPPDLPEGDRRPLDVLALEDVTERREAARRAAQSERLYRLIVESATGFAIITLDREGRIASWNTGAKNIFGYDADEAIGRDSRTIFTPEDQAAGVPEQEMTLALREGRSGDRRWHVRKDGSQFYGNGLLTPLLTEDGSAEGFIKIMTDETARKQAEERQDTLRRELGHRVQNVFATIRATASQLRRSCGSLEEFFDAFDARTRSLAQAYRLLDRPDFDGVTLREVVDLTLRPYQDRGLTVEGPPAVVPGPMALHLHMLLHELATNASRHGAFASDTGQVTLRWSIDPDGVDESGERRPRLVLTWRESGGPPVQPPTRRGFGTTLMEDLIPQQLEGDAVARYEPTGLVYELAVPWEEHRPGPGMEPQPESRGSTPSHPAPT